MSLDQSTVTVFAPGPLYPDLFDGATPIMLATEVEAPALFKVGVNWLAREHDIVEVIASNEDQAEVLAAEKIRRTQDLDEIEESCVMWHVRDATEDETRAFVKAQPTTA